MKQIRIRISNDQITIPVNYRQTLQGLIYRLMSADKDYASEVHDEGLTAGGYKLFTFSGLYGKSKYANKQLTFTGDMEFEVVNLPGHTKCCIGFYCREKGLFLSNETLGVYDGEKTIVPSYLVSYEDTIKSIEKTEKLDIKYILAPHYGILNEEQTEYFLDNMKSASEQTAQEILIA